jgi:hypothetical protein
MIYLAILCGVVVVAVGLRALPRPAELRAGHTPEYAEAR